MRPLAFIVGANEHPTVREGVYLVGIDHTDGARGTTEAIDRLAAGEQAEPLQVVARGHRLGLADNVTVAAARQLPSWRAQVVADMDRLHTDRSTRHPILAGSSVADLTFERRVLPSANLLWVADDLCEVVASARTTLGDDVTLRDIDPVWPQGVAIFERPLPGISAASHETEPMEIAGVIWSEHLVVDPDGGPPVRCLGMSWLTCLDFSRPTAMVEAAVRSMGDNPEAFFGVPVESLVADGRIVRLVGSTWAVAGRSDWPFGATIGDRLPGVDDSALEAMVEDRQTVYALWALMRLERVVETVTAKKGSKKSRREQRRPPVTVVRLRRTRTEASEHSRVWGWPRADGPVCGARPLAYAGVWSSQVAASGDVDHAAHTRPEGCAVPCVGNGVVVGSVIP